MRAIVKKIEIPINPGQKGSKNIERKVRVFGDYDTSPEAWVKWRTLMTSFVT